MFKRCQVEITQQIAENEVIQNEKDIAQAKEDKLKEIRQMLINEAMNFEYLKRCSKPCPACMFSVAKDGGCNKMTCQNCGKFFCWNCLEVIDGYKHFEQNAICWQTMDIPMQSELTKAEEDELVA